MYLKALCVLNNNNSFLFSGLDDLRDWTNNVQPSIPIYTAMRDFEVLALLWISVLNTSGSVLLPHFYLIIHAYACILYAVVYSLLLPQPVHTHTPR